MPPLYGVQLSTTVMMQSYLVRKNGSLSPSLYPFSDQTSAFKKKDTTLES